MRKFLLLLLLYQVMSPLYAVSIRGNNTIVTSAGINQSEEVSFRLNDLVAVNLTDRPFLKVVELAIILPPAYKNYQNSFVITLYNNLSSPPLTRQKYYIGRKILFKVLPPLSRMYIEMPLTEDFTGASSPGTFIIKKSANLPLFPIILKIEPVMKGIPTNLLSKVFKLKIRSTIIQKGIVSVKVKTPDGKRDYTVMIDNKKTDLSASPPLLSPGIHQLRIISDIYKEYTSRFTITPGRTTTLEVSLKKFSPSVMFDYPKGALVLLDGEKAAVEPGSELNVEPGEHIVTISVGDYTLSKKFTVLRDKNYKISLFIDIFIKEN